MQPRTKLQVQVKRLSDQLLNLASDQKQWAFKNCLKHVAYRTKTKTSCLDCGHQWAGKQKIKTCRCPECGVKLSIRDTLKKNLKQDATVALMHVVGDFQVNRFFEIESSHKAGWKPELFIREIVQQWFTPDGKLTIVGRTQSYGNGGYGGYGGDMEIRTNLATYYNSNKYDLYADKIMPDSKYLPIYKRNGFSDQIENVALYSMLKTLLQDSKLETLLKAKQWGLASVRLGRRDSDIYKYWDSIKICIRNKYIVKDPASYLDYLQMLQDAGKDLRSPKYVCPANFKKEHHRYVMKREKSKLLADAVRSREQAERRKLQAEQEQLDYVKEKANFFGIVFSEGELTIKFLESVQEFIAEGDAHQHCVYSSSYYTRPDSLCFSAKIEGKPVETIELSLKTMKIVQSRGMKNDPSIYHDQIIDLMNKNINVIRQRYKSLVKEEVA